MLASRHEESRLVLGESLSSQEVPVGPEQSRNMQHARADSAPLFSSENPPPSEQHSSQQLRHSTYFPTPESENPSDGQTRERHFVKKQASCLTTRSTRLERNRESVQELAAFLKNRDPPPDHFMSIPESFETTMESRSLPFKMFRRQNSKKGSPGPRHMRLPDSAVAAKTISGKWHIAISIPIEHDHILDVHKVLPSPEKQTPTEPTQKAPTGPITVLKPVIDMKELPKPMRVDSIIGPRGSSSQAQLKKEPFTSAINAEDTLALQNYYRQQSIQDLASKFEDSASNVARPASLQKDFVTSSPPDSRRQSEVTDHRQSAGTVYSDISLGTDRGHSRGPSSASSAPSAGHFVPLNGIESGNRLSGSYKSQKKRSSFTASTPLHSPSPISMKSPNSAAFLASPSVASIDSDLFSAQVSKADTAQGYNVSDIAGVHVTSIRNVARMPGPAPTRKLPDLPEGSDDGRSRSRSVIGSPGKTAASASTIKNDSDAATAGSATTLPDAVPAPEVVKSPRQLRQEKVKALRSRDMAALKAKTNYPQAIAANLAKGNKIAIDGPKVVKLRSRPSTPSRHTKRRSVSATQAQQDHAHCKLASAVTPVMTVANIEPPFDDFHFPSPPRSPPRKSGRKSINRSSIGRAPTPPRSVTPSLASSDDDALHLPRRASTARSLQTRSSYQSGSGSVRMNSLSKDKENDLEARMRRLERSHAMILQTLSAVVQMGVGFKELQKFLPVTESSGQGRVASSQRQLADGIRMKSEGKQGEDYDRDLVDMMSRGMNEIEPLMRELQMAARASQDAERETVR